MILVGRELKNSLPVGHKPYRVVRFKLPVEKGPWFYAFYNVRLFLFLLWNETDLLYANDLDTLLPNVLVSRINGSKLIYDSHEYFTGVPELENRPEIQRIWKRIEKRLVPRLSYIITVNESIADLYRNEYGRSVTVIRNVPDNEGIPDPGDVKVFRERHGLPADKRIVVLQGSGINVDRGGEEAVLAMKYLQDTMLLIIGGGDVIDKLKQLSEGDQVKGKVLFLDKMPYSQLIQFTRACDIGLTLDKDTNINYRFSLPNKIFDYIHAGIAVLASDLVEVKKIVEQYQTGCILSEHNPESLAALINYMLSNTDRLNLWKANSKKAAAELNWDHEKTKLNELLNEVFR